MASSSEGWSFNRIPPAAAAAPVHPAGDNPLNNQSSSCDRPTNSAEDKAAGLTEREALEQGKQEGATEMSGLQPSELHVADTEMTDAATHYFRNDGKKDAVESVETEYGVDRQGAQKGRGASAEVAQVAQARPADVTAANTAFWEANETDYSLDVLSNRIDALSKLTDGVKKGGQVTGHTRTENAAGDSASAENLRAGEVQGAVFSTHGRGTGNRPRVGCSHEEDDKEKRARERLMPHILASRGSGLERWNFGRKDVPKPVAARAATSKDADQVNDSTHNDHVRSFSGQSSPLPIRKPDTTMEDFMLQKHPAEPPEDPSSEFHFLEKMSTSLRRTVNDTPIPAFNREAAKAPNRGVEYQGGTVIKQEQDKHPQMARSANSPSSIRGANSGNNSKSGMRKSLPTVQKSGGFKQQAGRVENVRGSNGSFAPYDDSSQYGQQQMNPYPMQPLPPLPSDPYGSQWRPGFQQPGPFPDPQPPHGEASFYPTPGMNPYAQFQMSQMQYSAEFDPQIMHGAYPFPRGPGPYPTQPMQGAWENEHDQPPPELTYGYHMPDQIGHNPRAAIPGKRKAEEDLDEESGQESEGELGDAPEQDSGSEYDDEDEEEEVNIKKEIPRAEEDWQPSEDDAEPEEEFTDESDSEEDMPLAALSRARGGYAQRQIPVLQNEEEKAEGQDQGQDQDMPDVEQENEVQNMSSNTHNPTAPAGSPEDPRRHLVVKLNVPKQQPGTSATSDAAPTNEVPTVALPTFMQGSLPVKQAQHAPEAVDPNGVSWKLPAYNVELQPLPENKEDPPEVKVSLPGMPREELLLSVDHAKQEIHLLENLFIPGQQESDEPGYIRNPDDSRTSLLNFHTIAVMVLEAYAVHEEGDVVTTTRDHDGKEVKLTERDILQASIDEIFFAVMDRWRVGLAEETVKPANKMIRGVQEFTDITLDIIYYLEENGFVEGSLRMRKEKRDENVKTALQKRDGKANAAAAKKAAKQATKKEAEDTAGSEESTPKKRGRPPGSKKKSSDGFDEQKGSDEVKQLTAKKKQKTEPAKKATPAKKAPAKSKAKATPTPKKSGSVSVVKKAK